MGKDKWERSHIKKNIPSPILEAILILCSLFPAHLWTVTEKYRQVFQNNKTHSVNFCNILQHLGFLLSKPVTFLYFSGSLKAGKRYGKWMEGEETKNTQPLVRLSLQMLTGYGTKALQADSGALQ